MVVFKTGDMLKSDADILCQSVNCRGVMGSGLAKTIRGMYPDVFKSYKAFCSGVEPSELLGQVNLVALNGEKKVINFANIFGQLDYGRDGKQYTDYQALEKGFMTVYDIAKKYNLVVAIPYGIGCGLGGGDWEYVSSMVSKIFLDVVCEVWELK